MLEHADVLIVGAGISGVAAACYLQTRCPTKSFLILEGRSAIGGTWDLFRYPGIRSDSDMHTLGYSFRPWSETKAIADGPSILKYVRETAAEYGLDKKILFHHRARSADWSTVDSCWTVTAERGTDKEIVRFTCNFLYTCTGYYDYTQGYAPAWPGVERFHGRIIHPQHWPGNLDYAGKQVVVIGSGATAVTLVPALAEQVAHVTMLQRSPSYIIALPSEDALSNWLHRRLPLPLADRLARWRFLLLGMIFYTFTRRWPDAARRMLLRQSQEQLGLDANIEIDFAPHYNPWDQRLCVAPDGDLFTALKSGRASVVTDQIETFTETGIRLRSGKELPADLIVTATGLNLKLMGGIQLSLDGLLVGLSQELSYKGVMYSDIPNLASSFGYINASWTLKCELIARYVCRLLNSMDRHAYRQCTPRLRDRSIAKKPLLALTSGYIQRSLAFLPSQGSQEPWKMHQNYLLDLLSLRFNRIYDGTIEFK